MTQSSLSDPRGHQVCAQELAADAAEHENIHRGMGGQGDERADSARSRQKVDRKGRDESEE